MPVVPKRKMPDGTTVYYKATAGYICTMLTVIVLLLAHQFGWI